MPKPVLNLGLINREKEPIKSQLFEIYRNKFGHPDAVYSQEFWNNFRRNNQEQADRLWNTLNEMREGYKDDIKTQSNHSTWSETFKRPRTKSRAGGIVFLLLVFVLVYLFLAYPISTSKQKVTSTATQGNNPLQSLADYLSSLFSNLKGTTSGVPGLQNLLNPTPGQIITDASSYQGKTVSTTGYLEKITTFISYELGSQQYDALVDNQGYKLPIVNCLTDPNRNYYENQGIQYTATGVVTCDYVCNCLYVGHYGSDAPSFCQDQTVTKTVNAGNCNSGYGSQYIFSCSSNLGSWHPSVTATCQDQPHYFNCQLSCTSPLVEHS